MAMQLQSTVRNKIETTIKVSPEEKVKIIARECLLEADGKLKEAVELMTERVRADRKLFDALMDPLVESACYRLIGEAVHRNRKKIWDSPKANNDDDAKRVGALSKGNLMMFPLPGGLRLEDATKSDLSKAANAYMAQSKDMHHKARWLGLIAEEVPEGKLVGKVLTEEHITELQEKARNG